MKKYLVTAVFLTSVNLLFSQGNCSQTTYSGTATYYLSPAVGACDYDTSEYTPFFCSLDALQYDTARHCGACLLVSGNAGTQLMVVVDECMGCGNNNLDLSPAGFQAAVGSLSLTNGPINWQQVSCPWSPQPFWLTNSGANPWYANFVVHHAVNEVKLVELFFNSNWVPLTRSVSNNWWSAGITLAGDTALDVRVTDIFGQQIVLPAVNMRGSNVPQYANSNFTPCVATRVKNLNYPGGIRVFMQDNSLSVFAVKPIDHLQVIDLEGREVKAVRLDGDLSYTMGLPGLAMGIYQARAIYRDGTIGRASFCKLD